jgi:hypothetical protein
MYPLDQPNRLQCVSPRPPPPPPPLLHTVTNLLDSSGRSNDNGGHLLCQALFLVLHSHTTKEVGNLYLLHVYTKPLELVADLHRQYNWLLIPDNKKVSQTWNASSRVWQTTSAPTSPALGSNCCRIVKTKTAVFPMPDLAWHKMSIPRMACGMHSCCTAATRAARDSENNSVSQVRTLYHTFRRVLETTVRDSS